MTLAHVDEPGWRDGLAHSFAAIARDAGRLILEIYAAGPEARLKHDRSPVTEADERAEALIVDRLSTVLPTVPVVAEEGCAAGVLPDVGEAFILVDPLDGTKEFLKKNGEFTVNLALISQGVPIVGCVYAPAIDALYAGSAKGSRAADSSATISGARAWREIGGMAQPIASRAYPPAGLTALSSRSHPDPDSDRFLARLPILERQEAGSSLKFCRLAEGQADVYPRFGPTMEWDVAAGHAILRAAGGSVTTADGGQIRYGKREEGFRNSSFIAWGRQPIV